MSSTTETVERRRAIMQIANERGLTAGGVQVTISGAALPFAIAFRCDAQNDQYVEVGTYSWDVVEKAAMGNGALLR